MFETFKRFFGLQAKSLADPSADLLAIFGATSANSGVAVSPLSAMRSTPVRAAVQALAEPIGQLPLHLYRRSTGDARERDTAHPVAKILADPNDWTSAQDFREQLQRDALLWGNGYAFINRVSGKPVELIRLTPSAVNVEADSETGAPRYKLTNGERGEREIARGEIFHLKAPGILAIRGDSPVNECREAIGLALVLEKHAAKLFGSGARPGGVIEIPKGIGETGLAKMRAAWRAAMEGSDNAGKTAVLWDGATFKPQQFNSVDAQYLEIWKHVVSEISRVWRVPPHMLFEMGRATWANSAEQREEFLQFSLMRWLKAWQGEIRLKLLTPEERETYYAEFQTNDFLRANLQARADAYAKLIAARVLNPNECRAMENRAPYAGGDEYANPNVTPNAGAQGNG